VNLKKWIQVILVGSCIVTLAACSTGRKPQDGTAVDDANAAYNEAQSSGLGDESSFGDKATGTKMSSSNKNTYYFDFDSNVVHQDDRPAIASNADHLASNPSKKVMLEGHTDPRGSREYNIGLGERRAKAVAQIMTEKGVSPSQVRVVSYGAEKLASNGHSEADYQQDRRAVLVNTQ
jgi:peptidoglycan-associated lipoprotein